MTSNRFRLFPFRSPLLGESRLISFPPGTEMFHFPGLASSSDFTILIVMGYPIRKPPDQSMLPAPRRISLVAASFIASLCQGILHLPFKSYRKSLLDCYTQLFSSFFMTRYYLLLATCRNLYYYKKNNTVSHLNCQCTKILWT